MKQKRKLIRRIAVFLVIAIIIGSAGKYNCKRTEATDTKYLSIKEEKEYDMYVTADKLNAKKDDTITLTFTYTGLSDVSWVEFYVNYDKSLLQVYDIRPINRLCDAFNYTIKDDFFIMSVLNEKNEIHKGEQFLSIKFKCLKDIGKESIIKFKDIAFTSPVGDDFVIDEGYPIKLTPEFGIDIVVDKVNGIKKNDIITFIFTYTGTTPVVCFDFNFSYNKDIFKVYSYELIDKLYRELFLNDDNLEYTRVYMLMADSINGVDAYENLLYQGEQFFKIQIKCLQDIPQESTIKFSALGFETSNGLVYETENYYNSFEFNQSGTSEPAPSNSPLPTATPSPTGSPSPVPTGSAVAPNCEHLFNDYDYTSPVKDSPVILYGNGINKKIDGNVVNNKQFTAYTDILPSYNYTLNSRGIIKPSSGKVIAGITTSSTKPVVSKNKIVDRDAAKIAKARIKNGQVTITATGKEKGLVYLWIIDTGKNGAYECCPVNVLMAPKRLETRDISGSKLKNPSINAGSSLDVCVAGIAPDGTTTDDCTYIATVADASQSYIKVTPVQGKNGQFKITATGLKNNKDTKVSITFTCNENKKKIKLTATIKK